MKSKKLIRKRIAQWGIAGGLVLALLAFCYALSWIVTCGIIKLITLCFGWTFSWAIATGIWLIICIAKSIFSHHTTVNK